ncbi:hypothetical protein [Corynebacterium freiburgense]|uniref:hypothetical protein n=1 Tax=Corynebacterium freiburgense TaxID=556548 RepID=UPI0003FA786B|nr:hypothetical protein [Corynebacterium freiburgense]WJZ02166.1 hypothetical protein CFREI_04340 [Corynebacterium freiburgense]
MMTYGEIAEQAADGVLPMLTLEAFFQDNSIEDSIAPNQWEFGRPPLAELFDRISVRQQDSDIAWVRVTLHPDTQELNPDDPVCGDHIAFCTTASPEEIENRVDYQTLESSGVIKATPRMVQSYSDIPLIPDGYDVLFLIWD